MTCEAVLSEGCEPRQIIVQLWLRRCRNNDHGLAGKAISEDPSCEVVHGVDQSFQNDRRFRISSQSSFLARELREGRSQQQDPVCVPRNQNFACTLSVPPIKLTVVFWISAFIVSTEGGSMSRSLKLLELDDSFF